MPDDKELYGGLIRLHILHHAAEKPIFGLWIITELERHGYRLSPGTLYPILHGLERKGYLKAAEERFGRRMRRLYSITASGRKALATATGRVQELFGELFEPKVNRSAGKVRKRSSAHRKLSASTAATGITAKPRGPK